jgi:hypothetical protein
MPWNQSNNDKDPWERDRRQVSSRSRCVINKFMSRLGIFGSKNQGTISGGPGKAHRLVDLLVFFINLGGNRLLYC